MQDSDDLIFVKLDPVDPVSQRRHGHKPVTYLIELSDTVVSPHVRQTMLQKFFNLIISRNRLVYQAVLIKLIAGKSVKGVESVQKPSIDSFAAL